MSNNPTPEQQAQREKQIRQARRWRRKRQWNNMRYSVFGLLALLVYFVIALVFLTFFPRSKVSNIENRTLTSFPEFSLSSYFSGEYTAGIATWYDDTVPFRDTMKNGGSNFKKLFGFTPENSVTFINQDVVANDMNGATGDRELSDSDTTTAAGAESTETQGQGHVAVPAEQSAAPTVEPDQKDFTKENAEFDMSNGLMLVMQNGHWRCMPLFGGGSDENYVNALNTLQQRVGDSVKIYSMPAPLASQFYTPSNAADYTVDQSARFDSIADQMDDRIISINLCPVLAKHTEEDIYLRTDHHWAQLGAYYAARTFAETAGVDFQDLSEYTEGVMEGYVGTMYSYSEDARLLNDPEDFVYYVPNTQYRTYYYDTAFNYEYEDVLIWDVEVEGAYMMYMYGDMKIVKIVNDTVHNGRKLMVVKDSYGNAEIPFYTASFEEVYVTDMRYFDLNMVNFIQDLGITDVLFTMCSYSVVGTNAENLIYLIDQNADYPVVDQQAAGTAQEPGGDDTMDATALRQKTGASVKSGVPEQQPVLLQAGWKKEDNP